VVVKILKRVRRHGEFPAAMRLTPCLEIPIQRITKIFACRFPQDLDLLEIFSLRVGHVPEKNVPR
jgi:hypothetical protein